MKLKIYIISVLNFIIFVLNFNLINKADVRIFYTKLID